MLYANDCKGGHQVKREYLAVGTQVNVERCVIKHDSPNGKRTMMFEEFKSPVFGIIVGGTFFHEGTTEYADVYCFNVEKKTFVYLVRTGFINKALKVLPRDVAVSKTIIYMHNHHLIPYFQHGRRPWREQEKEDMREEMKSVPRDSKGRWMKTGK